MPNLQDIEQFKAELDSIGNEAEILAERGESISSEPLPDEGLSDDLSALLDDTLEGAEAPSQEAETAEPDAFDFDDLGDLGDAEIGEEEVEVETVDEGVPSDSEVPEDDFDIDRQAIPQNEDCQWFTVDGKDRPRKVRTLQGEPEWLDGIDPSKLEIELRSRILKSRMAKVLLESQRDLLISREQKDGRQVIVVANGSFLLNLPLVNHEHRKLAGRLIADFVQQLRRHEPEPSGAAPGDP